MFNIIGYIHKNLLTEHLGFKVIGKTEVSIRPNIVCMDNRNDFKMKNNSLFDSLHVGTP